MSETWIELEGNSSGDQHYLYIDGDNKEYLTIEHGDGGNSDYFEIDRDTVTKLRDACNEWLLDSAGTD